MSKLNSIDSVLDFAVEREQEAVDFYTELAGQTDNAQLKKILESFAKVEAGHKKKLQAAKAGKAGLSGDTDLVDLRVSDYLVEVEANPEMTIQDALIIAMKREKVAMEMYRELAEIVEAAELQKLFHKLSREENAHKHSFEIFYEEHFLSDN